MILPCEIPQLDIPDVGRNHILGVLGANAPLGPASSEGMYVCLYICISVCLYVCL